VISVIAMMRPQFVLFGDSITEQSFRPGGWGSALADCYSRQADIVLRGYSGYNTMGSVTSRQDLPPQLLGLDAGSANHTSSH
jgi:hypothetical protein